MARSALEAEVEGLIDKVRRELHERDRAVVVAFLLAAVPFPIANLLSLIISVLNLLLIWSGRLSHTQLRAVIVSILLAILSTSLFFYIFGEINRDLVIHIRDTLSSLADVLGSLMRDSLKRLRGGQYIDFASPSTSSNLIWNK